MAKGDKAAKSGKRVRIPKKIAGVKLPKQLRKQGEKLIEKAQSPQGREAIAAGLTMVATVAAARMRAKAEAAPAPEPKARGGPGIPPEWNDAITRGMGAFQVFMAGVKK